MKTLVGNTNFFEESYVINLARRVDRWEQFEPMITQSNIGVVSRFDAIRNNEDGPKGCAESHLAVIRMAKERQLKNILIFEDDAMFVDNIASILEPAVEQLGQLDWDFFYLGGRLIAPAIKMTPNLARIIAVYCTHAYAVNHTMYDKILEYDHDKWKAIDVYYSMITREVNSYICYPIAVHQRPSVSDLIGGVMDYRQLFQWSYDEHLK